MLHTLTILRERDILEVKARSINRVVVRIFNFFEENRIQSKIFQRVQEDITLTRYASSWSDIITFLLRLLANNDSCRILAIRYLKLLPGTR